MDGLTEQQQRFVIHMANDGVTPTEAARRAGYSQKSAKEIGSQLLRKDHVAAALRKEQARVLGTLGGKSLKVIGDILDDDEAPLGVKLDAAKTVLDRIGLVAARTPTIPVSPRDNGKLLSEMEVSELEGFLAALRKVKEQQAVTAEAASSSSDWREASDGPPSFSSIN